MIEFLGSKVGVIYLVDDSGAIKEAFENYPDAAMHVRMRSLVNSPTVGERLAFASQTITASAVDTITAITINGVNQIPGSTVAVSAVPATVAGLIAAAVNLRVPASGPNYTMKVDGANMTWYADAGTGDSANGDVIGYTLGTPSNLTITGDTIIHSGSNPAKIYDDRAFMPGTRVFLDPTPTASTGTLDLATAREITNLLNLTGVQGSSDVQAVTLSNNTITFTRNKQDTLLVVSGGGGNLDAIIGNGQQSGDRIRIIGAGAGNGVTLRDVSVSTTVGENIYLDNAESFTTESTPAFIQFIYYNDPVNGFVYGESGRTGVPITSTSVRAAAATPIRLGNHEITVTGAGGSFALTPGNSGASPNGFNNLLIQGTATLGAGYTVTVDPTDAVAGDFGWISGTGSAITVGGGNNLVICGYTIDAAIALAGAWRVDWTYDGSSLHYNLSIDPQVADWVTTSMIAPLAVDTAALAADSVTSAKIVDGTIVTADLDPANIDLNTVGLAGSISSGLLDASLAASLGNGVKAVSVSLTSADILSLNSTPIVAVAAPGAGVYIEVISASIFYTYLTAVYATHTQVNLRIDTATLSQFVSPGVLAVGSSVAWRFNSQAPTGSANQLIANKALLIETDSGDPTGSGTGTAIVKILYREFS